MKKILTLLALLPLAALADQVRILPLGDSITEGVGWEAGGGYRAVLRQKLLDAGYDVEFVGNNTTNDGGIEGLVHEGHGGWYLYTIREAIPGWMSTMKDPHVILLMVGTNDIGGYFDYKNILYRLSGLLDDLSAKQPSAKIIVSTLTPRDDTNNRVDMSDGYWNEGFIKPYYNNGLPALVAEHQAKGQNVSMIDLYSKLTIGEKGAEVDFDSDRLHPNESGYRKMAQAWFDGIQSVLPVSATTNMAPNKLAVVRTVLDADRLGVRIYFNRPVSDAAGVLSNYAFSGQFQPKTVTIADDRRSVSLRAGELGGTTFSRDEFTRLKISNVTCQEDGALIDERTITTFALRTPRAGHGGAPPEVTIRTDCSVSMRRVGWRMEGRSIRSSCGHSAISAVSCALVRCVTRSLFAMPKGRFATKGGTSRMALCARRTGTQTGDGALS